MLENKWIHTKQLDLSALGSFAFPQAHGEAEECENSSGSLYGFSFILASLP